MKKKDWKDTAELIGIAAIVASLIFVGLELRQSQEIALSEAYQARASIEVANASAMASIPEYLSGLAKIVDGGSTADLTSAEYIAHQHYLAAMLGIWENDFYQHESGFLPADHWAKSYGNMLCDLAIPMYREMYRSTGWSYRTSFSEIVEEAMAEAENDPKGCR